MEYCPSQNSSRMFYPDLRRCTVHDECTFLLVFHYLLIMFDKRIDKKGQFPYQTKYNLLWLLTQSTSRARQVREKLGISLPLLCGELKNSLQVWHCLFTADLAEHLVCKQGGGGQGGVRFQQGGRHHSLHHQRLPWFRPSLQLHQAAPTA